MRSNQQWRSMVCAVALLLSSLTAFGASESEKLMRTGNIPAAWTAAERELSANPQSLDAHERYIDLGLSLGLRHHIEAKYRAFVAESPSNADRQYLLGRVLPSADAAVEAYSQALVLDPGHPRAPMGIAAVARAQGEFEKALLNYRKSLAKDGTLVEAWTGAQASLLLLGRIAEARTMSVEFLAKMPDTPEAYVSVATLDPNRSLDVLRIGVQRLPWEPQLAGMYGRSLLDAGRFREASVELERVHGIAPGYAEVGFLRFGASDLNAGVLALEDWRVLDQMHRGTDPGVAALRSIVERRPRSAIAWLALGRAQGAASDLRGALESFRRAAELRGDETEVQASYGLALAASGSHSEALNWLERARASRPSDASLAAAAVSAARRSGADGTMLRKSAAAAYQQHPYDLRCALELAAVMSQQGDTKGAYEALKDALPRIPDPRLVVALAAAARDAGYIAEAAEILERLARTLNNDSVQRVADQLKKEAQDKGMIERQ